MVSFEVTAGERRLIAQIADRAVPLFKRRIDRLTITMDLTATHANGCPLRLSDMLDADDFNLVHDVAGINRFLDRETGRLTECFRPRFAMRQQEAA